MRLRFLFCVFHTIFLEYCTLADQTGELLSAGASQQTRWVSASWHYYWSFLWTLWVCFWICRKAL